MADSAHGNLLMTRFLQAAFPSCYFIIVKRHPVAVSMASQKWKVNVTSLYRMFEHWLDCHRFFEEDKKYLKHVYELKSEDYVKNSGKYHREIAALLGTRVPEPPREDQFRTVTDWRDPARLLVPEHRMEETTGVHNDKYFARWRNLVRNSFFKNYYRYIARKYEPGFAKYGYSLTSGFGPTGELVLRGETIDAIIGPLYCRGADAWALVQRIGMRCKWFAKRKIRTILPEFVFTRIRQVRQRELFGKA
jgi:hypothetical protein